MRRFLLPLLLLVPIAWLVLPGPREAPEQAPAPAPETAAETAPEAVAATGALVVEIEGRGAGGGPLALALFADREAFEAGRPLRTARLPRGEATWRLEGLPPGTYAVKAYHDLDDDGVLDRGAFGAPSEPYGFSNDARGTFGPPTFEAASFGLDATGARLTVRVR